MEEFPDTILDKAPRMDNGRLGRRRRRRERKNNKRRRRKRRRKKRKKIGRAHV